MILWTVQHQQVIDILNENRIYHVSDNYILFGEDDTHPHLAYNWLSSEMAKRISPSPIGVSYPIWAWYSWEGLSGKPDMRTNGYAQTGTPIVRMKLDIPDNEVLLSNFDLWHYALNHWYLPISKSDENNFEKRNKSEKEFAIQDSWQRIFDLSLHDDGYIFGDVSNKTIQATFWELRHENVVSVESFVAR